jgi:hypothetical protein
MRTGVAAKSADRISGIVVLMAAALSGVLVFVVALPLAFSSPFPTPRQGDWIIQSSVGQTATAPAAPPEPAAVASAAPMPEPQPEQLAAQPAVETKPAAETKVALATTRAVKTTRVIKPKTAVEAIAASTRWQLASAPPSDTSADDVTTGSLRLAMADDSAPIAIAPPPAPKIEVPAEAAQIKPVERKSEAAPKKPDVNPMDAVDEYLWQVYQRAPVKSDSTGDFSWKDPAAAKRLHMSLKDYVIRGMEPDFREQLYHAGHAMDARGIRWSMLSAFRDDYRQALAAGFKARPGNSLHGGSRAVGGYGHGRAIDVKNAEGDDETVWRWFDAYGAKYGLRRPMPGYDPAHIQAGGSWHDIAQALRQGRTKVAVGARQPGGDTAAVKSKSAKAM